MATTDNQNIWFGVSMGLMGLIVGFVVATFMNGSVRIQPSPGGQPQVAASVPKAPQAPTSQPAAPTPQAAAVVVPVSDADHYRGNKNAKIVLIEYSDYECPFCSRVHPTIQQIMDTYPNDVAWVYRHFPLSFHPQAMPAAIASECAAKLGGDDAFWKFTDILFEDRNFDYAAVAKQIGLNEEKFKSCLTDEAVTFTALVNQQMKDGSLAGVTGTPGNILYNPKTKESRLIPGARPFEMFKTDIDAMLEAAK